MAASTHAVVHVSDALLLANAGVIAAGVLGNLVVAFAVLCGGRRLRRPFTLRLLAWLGVSGALWWALVLPQVVVDVRGGQGAVAGACRVLGVFTRYTTAASVLWAVALAWRGWVVLSRVEVKLALPKGPMRSRRARVPGPKWAGALVKATPADASSRSAAGPGRWGEAEAVAAPRGGESLPTGQSSASADSTSARPAPRRPRRRGAPRPPTGGTAADGAGAGAGVPGDGSSSNRESTLTSSGQDSGEASAAEAPLTEPLLPEGASGAEDAMENFVGEAVRAPASSGAAYDSPVGAASVHPSPSLSPALAPGAGLAGIPAVTLDTPDVPPSPNSPESQRSWGGVDDDGARRRTRNAAVAAHTRPPRPAEWRYHVAVWGGAGLGTLLANVLGERGQADRYGTCHLAADDTLTAVLSLALTPAALLFVLAVHLQAFVKTCCRKPEQRLPPRAAHAVRATAYLWVFAATWAPAFAGNILTLLGVTWPTWLVWVLAIGFPAQGAANAAIFFSLEWQKVAVAWCGSCACGRRTRRATGARAAADSSSDETETDAANRLLAYATDEQTSDVDSAYLSGV